MPNMTEMTVIEQKIEIPMGAGTAEAILYRPEENGTWPAILHLPDIFSIRPEREAMAKRQAAEGYVVLLPNIFWRFGKVPVFDFAPQFGEERTMTRMGELRASLTPDQQAEDLGVYLDFLAKDPHVERGQMGVVGYCFSGAMALRAAAVRPDVVAAAASFHGSELATEEADSPHLVLPQVKARLYFGHAIEDRFMPAEMIARLDAALADWGGNYESETYDGAYHGWTIQGPVYNHAQAERHFDTLMGLFNEELR